jgi:putative DNA primase/helicase
MLFLSAGEVGLAEHMAEANRRTRAGQELRMIDLPADAGAGRGLFEELHAHDSAGNLAQFLTRATEGAFGTPGRAWLLHLVENTEGLSRTLRRDMDAIEAEFVPELASGQVQRVGRRFALVAVAGEMATDAGLTGWPAGAATDAARRCFNAWIEARPAGIGMSEEEQMLRRARLWFAAHGRSARFPDFARIDDDRAPQAINQAGWRREAKHDTGKGLVETWHEWLVFPEVFAAELCGNGNPRPLLRLLDSLGHMHKEKRDGYTCGVEIEGAGRTRVYRVKASILEESGEE